MQGRVFNDGHLWCFFGRGEESERTTVGEGRMEPPTHVSSSKSKASIVHPCSTSSKSPTLPPWRAAARAVYVWVDVCWYQRLCLYRSGSIDVQKSPCDRHRTHVRIEGHV